MVALPSPDILTKHDISTELKSRRANLGDNYVRTARAGLNPTTDFINVAWSYLTTDDANTVYDALIATAGVDPIEFTPRGESTEKSYLLTGSPKKAFQAGLLVGISATLEERHLP